MKKEEEIEEALESLWINLEEKSGTIAMSDEHFKQEFGISKENLIKKGFIQKLNGNTVFTSEGRKLAEQTIRRHRLSERLFHDVIDTKREDMEKGACQLEHVVKKEIEEKICRLLGHPKTCPHGKPIPPGKCCESSRKILEESVMPLSRLKRGEKAIIAYLKTENSRKMQKLMGMGIMPGSRIHLNHSYPSFVFSVEYSQFAVDADLAHAIVVRKDNQA